MDNKSSTKTRVLTSIVGMVLMIPLLVFSNTWPLVLLAVLLSTASCFELLRCAGLSRKYIVAVPCLMASLTVPLLTRYFSPPFPKDFFSSAAIIFFISGFVVLAGSVFAVKTVNIRDSAATYTMVMYVTMSSSCIVLVRDLESGKYIYLLVFVAAWCSDIFAYFAGRTLGKHKLCPDVSPKKTVEGAIGGLVGSVVCSLFYGFMISRFANINANYLHIAIAALLMSCVSVLGDLIASLFKRTYGVKDYGRILPGHGGIIDRFDSVFATAPFLMFLYRIFDGFALFSIR